MSALRIAEHAQRFRHRAVDDLEVAAAGELLELHQREVRLDAGGVAIHHQADRAGRRDHGRLRVAVAVLLRRALSAWSQADLACATSGRHEFAERPRSTAWSSRTGGCDDLLVAGLLAIGGAAMVAHHAQHVLAVLLEAREGPELLRHLGRGRIRDAGHDRRERAADRAAGVGVVRDAGRHQQAADIGVAEAERAVLVGELRDLLARELRHQHRDFEHHGPEPDGVLVALDVERAGLRVAEGEQVDRREIAGRVVEEHVFRARIAERGSGPTPGRCASRSRWCGIAGRDRRRPRRRGRSSPTGRAPSAVLATLPGLVRQVRSQSPSASTALRNSSVTRTELFEFCPETVR